MQTVPPYKPNLQGKFQDLVIPTNDSVRNSYFLNLFINLNTHMLLTGPTGTGKTVNVINELNINFYNEKFTNLITAFSG
jgi:dynein heavy chain